MEQKTYSKGQPIFKEGDEGDQAFVIKEGAVDVVKSIDGKMTVLGSIGKGAMFGEMALIDSKPRMASALSSEDGTTLIVISRKVFEQKLNTANPFIQGVLHALSEQIRQKITPPPSEQAPEPKPEVPQEKTPETTEE